MRLASQTMMKLMAYADGEQLDAADVKEIEALLAKDSDAVRFVAQLSTLGDYVKMGHGARDAKTAATFDVADAVMAKVKDTKPDAPAVREKKTEKTNVVSLEARRASRTKVYVVVAAALALAASVVFFSRPKETPMAKGPTVTPAAPQAEAALPGVVVEPIDSPGQTVKVIYGPGTNEMTTHVIIWVDEERK